MTQKTMIDQFNQLKEVKKKAKENNPKGPVDLKSIRQELNAANLKNRRP